MSKIVTLGELMLRLSPNGNDRFIQTEIFRIIPGGGEANVAISLANYGHDAVFVTKLPKHEIGQIALNAMRRYGVDTSFIARGGERIGLYYAETGASMRPSKVIYDRAHSAIAEADPADFDFDAIMEGADWFHWSGITPAISDKAAELTRLACEAAKRHGVTVSVDLNFRKKLWTSEKAISVMRPLMKYVDVCIGNEEDAELCLGFKPDADVEGGKTDAAGYEGIFRQMKEEFGFKYVVSTLRESFSATHNGWKALIYDGKEFYQSRQLLGWSHPWPTHESHTRRSPRVRGSCQRPQAHYQRRLQPRQHRRSGIPRQRQRQRTSATVDSFDNWSIHNLTITMTEDELKKS